MKLVFLSDIHANLTAFQAVVDVIKCYKDAKVYVLGDIIDYGLRPNETIELLKTLKPAVVLEGNHENALLNKTYERFSEDRGREMSRYTETILSQKALFYIKKLSGKAEMELRISGKRVLLIHGSIEDRYWGKIDEKVNAESYQEYDVVISGHTHKRHYIEKYYACSNAETRNRQKVVFINPGSVGQPRNLNPLAQFVMCDEDLTNWEFREVCYDISAETVLYKGQVDDFYKKRLLIGV